MILGIGTDIVDMQRLADAAVRTGERLARRILSAAEFAAWQSYGESRRLEFLAGRFAAKEAMAKAVGCGLGRLQMQRVSVMLGPSGLQVAWETPPGADAAQPPWPLEARWHVSISHSSTAAVAMAVLEQVAEGGLCDDATRYGN